MPGVFVWIPAEGQRVGTSDGDSMPPSEFVRQRMKPLGGIEPPQG